MSKAVFVGSLYVWSSSRRVGQKYRDSNKVMLRRMTSVCIVSIFAPFWTGITQPTLLGIAIGWHALLATIVGLSLTLILFLGPLVMKYIEWVDDMIDDTEDDTVALSLKSIKSWRTLIVGPFAEEFVFRANLCPMFLIAGYSPTETILLTPLFFGIAHIHHIVNDGPLLALVQQLYTTIFGWYSAFLFVRTGSFYAPFIAHSFCNYMGFPPIGKLQNHPNKSFLWCMFGLGLVLFIILLFPLTDPDFHNSFYTHYFQNKKW